MSIVASALVKKTLLSDRLKAYGKPAIVLAIDKRASEKVELRKVTYRAFFLILQKVFKVEQSKL